MSYLVIDKTESAFVSILQAPIQALDLGCFVTDGNNSGEDKQPPMIICGADGESFEEDPHGSGNFWVICTMRLVTHATKTDSDTPDDVRATIISVLHSAIMSGTLEADLTAAEDDYTVFPGSAQFLSPRSGTDGDMWIDEFPVRLYCCAADLP